MNGKYVRVDVVIQGWRPVVESASKMDIIATKMGKYLFWSVEI